MKLNGEDHRTEAAIPERINSDGTSSGIYYFIFHDGKLFFTNSASEDLPYEEQFQLMYSLDLETGELTQLFQDFLTPNVTVQAIFPVGDLIYAESIYRDGQTGDTEPWLIEMNPGTGEVRKLLARDTSNTWFVTQSALYYWDTEAGFMEYDLTSGETVQKGKPVDDAVWALRDDRWIYLCGNVTENWASSTFYFFDIDYNFVDQIDVADGLRMKYSDSDYYYYFGSRDELVSARLAKNQIGSGNLKLEPIATEET